MDLLPSRGRPGVSLLLTVERHLTAADIFRAATQTDAPKVPVAGLQKLKAVHHGAARMLAAGKTVAEVAYTIGKTPQRVGEWQRSDPSFQDLIAYYKDQIEDIGIADAQRIHMKLLDVAETALDEVGDRLDDDAKRTALPMSELRELVKLGGDRTVAPPKTAQPTQTVPTKVTFNIGTRDIKPKDDSTDPHAPATATIEQE